MVTEVLARSDPQAYERRRAAALALERSATAALSFAVFVIAVSVIGWLFDVPQLSSLIPGWPPMHPLMAVFGIGAAATLRLLARNTLYARRAAYLVCSVVFAIALLVLYAQRENDWHYDFSAYAAVTATIMLAATGLKFRNRFWARRLAELCAVTAMVLAVSGLVGVTYRLMLHMPALVELSLAGGLSMIALAFAVIAGQPDNWLLDKLTDRSVGAIMLRRALPMAVLFPILLGLIRMAAQRAGWMDTAGGSLFLTLLTILALAVFAWWLAFVLNRIDAERQAAEREAETQREWLHVTLGSIHDAVIATDPDCVVRVMNPAAASLLGEPVESLMGESLAGRVALLDENRQPVECPLRSVLRGEGAHARELVLRRDDGREVPVEVGVAPIRDAEGATVGGVMVMRDVSERLRYVQVLRDAYAELDRRVAERTSALEQANAALHETLALFRGVAESTPDLIFVKDLELRIAMANPATCRLFGRSEQELMGRRFDELIDDAELARTIDEHDRRVLDSGRVERVEQLLKTAEGYRTFLSTKSPLRDVNGRIIGLISVATDITERKRIENDLREAQRFTQGLLDTAPLVLYLLDLDHGRMVFVSGMVQQVLGFDAEALRGLSMQGLLRLVHPEDRRALMEHLRGYRDEQDGLRTFELRFRHQDGDWRWLYCRERLFDPAARTRLVLGVAIDVSDRRQAERELEQLIEAEKRLRYEAERANRAKDEFLAVVSHELRSPLNALRGWSFLLGNSNPVDPGLLERAVQAIKRNVDHQARLIDDLLDTSRIMSGKLNLEHRPLNLIETVNSAIEVVRPGADAKRLAIVFEHAPGPLSIEGDPARLHQVVVNLLSNAVKFTPEEGRITITAGTELDMASITVTDTGIGIDAEFLPRLFQRFTQADSSTTRKHGGLGIGLALVRHLVELHGGTVSAASEGLGKGATFTVKLPLPKARVMMENLPESNETEAENALLAGVRICALDDDPDARDIIAHALKRAGAQVYSASSGADLIALLDEQLPHTRPDILLLDLAMPGEDGFGVLASVRALEQRKGLSVDEAIPAIAVTAFAELSRVRIVEAGFIERMAKPFDPGALVATIRRVLANKRGKGNLPLAVRSSAAG